MKKEANSDFIPVCASCMFKYSGRFLRVMKAEPSSKCKECGASAFAILKLRPDPSR
jgi:hypothetical protein